MSRVKVHGTADITLPDEARRKLGVVAGDDLEVEMVENGVLLKRVAEAERRQAWRELIAAMGRGRPTPEQAAKPIDQQEEEIFEMVEAYRHRHD